MLMCATSHGSFETTGICLVRLVLCQSAPMAFRLINSIRETPDLGPVRYKISLKQSIEVNFDTQIRRMFVVHHNSTLVR